MSESARGEGGRVWVPRTPQDIRDPREIPESQRCYFLEERYPKYGNLVPRDIATREIFDICTNDGLSVEKDRLCVYLDLTHLPREMLDKKLGGILEIYEKFQGVDPRVVPMKIFPAVHYSMGGLWVDFQKSASGGLEEGSPRNQQTNIPGFYAIGECDYQYHGANRLGREFAPLVHFQWPFRSPWRVEFRCLTTKSIGRRTGATFSILRSQAGGEARGITCSSWWKRKSLCVAPRTRQSHDAYRYGGPTERPACSGLRRGLSDGRAAGNTVRSRIQEIGPIKMSFLQSLLGICFHWQN